MICSNCKRLLAPPQQPGRPQDRKGGKRVSAKKGEEGFRSGGRREVKGVKGGGVGGGGVGPVQDPPTGGTSTAAVCSSSKRF